MSRDSPKLRRPGERSGMVPGGMRRYPAARRFVIEREDCVRRTPRLERANLLEVLALEKERAAAGFIQTRAGQHGRPMNMRTNALVRDANGSEIEHG